MALPSVVFAEYQTASPLLAYSWTRADTTGLEGICHSNAMGWPGVGPVSWASETGESRCDPNAESSSGGRANWTEGSRAVNSRVTVAKSSGPDPATLTSHTPTGACSP